MLLSNATSLEICFFRAEITRVANSDGYDPKDPTVFFGHYWLQAEKPALMANNVCCLDYSVAKEGMLVAYRHYFDQPNGNDNFITIHSISN